ncbi:MAG: zinc/manganese transport system substrate-binding protein [Oleiphilaceae bacterium]|jgi:zinc/manganese transport system substrate-binding protein
MIYKWAVRVLFLVASLSVFSGAFAASQGNEGVEEKDAEKMQVVTTFSVLADLVRQIGGDYIDVHTLVDWDEDAHVYHPTPSDVRYLAKADLLVVNGLGFEGWLERLISASKFEGQLVIATEGVDAIKLGSRSDHEGHDHGHGHHEGHEKDERDDHGKDKQGYDPHAWHSLFAVKIYVQNILNGLIKLDGSHQTYYQANASQYMVKLNDLAIETRGKLAKLSKVQRNIVMPHNAFAYLARDYDLHVFSLKGINAESEASAAQIAQVIRKIKAKNVHVVFSETTADDRLIKLVQQETAARMGGALISGALSRKLAPTYLEMMRYNIERITQALSDK